MAVHNKNALFIWTSAECECNNPALVDCNFHFFSSFNFNNEKYKIGDFVIVNKSLIPGQHPRSKVAKLLSCYESAKPCHSEEPFRGTVRWYTKAEDISYKLNPLHFKMDNTSEVIEDMRSFDVFISLENIKKKCNVIFGTPSDPVKLIEHLKLDKRTNFSCKYRIETSMIYPINPNNDNGCDINQILKEQNRLSREYSSPIKVVSPIRIKLQRTENCAEKSDSDSDLAVKKTFPTGKIYSSAYSCKRSATAEISTDDEDNQRENAVAVRKSKSPSKTLRPSSEKTASLNKSTTESEMFPQQKNCVKRNLNTSFGETPEKYLLNYCVVEAPDDNDTEKPLKMKLRLSSNNTKSPVVLLKRLSIADEAVEKFINDEDRQLLYSPLHQNTPVKTKRISFCERNLEDNDGSIRRRSTRRTERISYTDFTSPHSEDVASPVKTSTRSGRRDGTTDSVKTLTPRRSSRRLSTDTCETTLKRRSTRKDRLDVIPESDSSRNKRHKQPSMNSSQRFCEAICTPKKTPRQQQQKLSDASPRTPKSQRLSNCATPKSVLKNTPGSRARLIRDGVIQPSVQERECSIVHNKTPLARARSQLHVSYVPQSLPCRENEFEDIFGFLEGKLIDGCGGCMYISGVPGTGKTATITDVIRCLQECALKRKVPKFTYININGMRLTEPRQSYVEILKQLTGQTLAWEQAQTILENKFTKAKINTIPTVLVVDELDILCTKRQDVVYNLLDWPTKSNAQLIVVTIANTMDLPERLLMSRVTSRLGLTRLTFQAYTHKQLQEIVMKRLTGTNAFNPDAVQLVARKVASVSGDARRALDICRRAAEMAELDGKNTLVSMKHINDALDAMITQPKVQAIKHCSRLEQLLLQAVVAEAERTGVEETNFAAVYNILPSVAALDGFKMVSITVALSACSRLGSCRLLLVDKTDIYQKIILNVSADDVYYALKD